MTKKATPVVVELTLDNKIDEVLEAYRKLLDDSFALDYCGFHGKDRVMILNSPDYKKRSRQIRAQYYVEEIKGIESIIGELDIAESNEEWNGRFGEESNKNRDDSKILRLRMQAQQMRRDLLSLTTSANEIEEADAINVFYVGLTKEEFENLKNVEVHEGAMNNAMQGEDEESLDTITRARNTMSKERKKKTRDAAIKHQTIEYTNEDGDVVIEEVV
jgi:hypothetical protein